MGRIAYNLPHYASSRLIDGRWWKLFCILCSRRLNLSKKLLFRCTCADALVAFRKTYNLRLIIFWKFPLLIWKRKKLKTIVRWILNFDNDFFFFFRIVYIWEREAYVSNIIMTGSIFYNNRTRLESEHFWVKEM